MKYIVHKRFRDKAICGDVNLPAMTECECVGGIISHKGNQLCFVRSENAYQHFAINEDGNGMERGRLTQAIQKSLAKRDDEYQKRWDLVWEDPICQDYKREDYDDFWLWSHEFFNADIDVLRHITQLIGAKEDA